MTSIDRSNRTVWVLYVVAVLVIASVGVPFYLDHNRAASETKIVSCLQRYADAQYDRSAFLQQYLQPRNDAQSNYLDATLRGAPAAELARLRTVYATAQQQYTAASKANPLPPPPRLACPSSPRAPSTPPGTPHPSTGSTPPAAPSRSPRSEPARTGTRTSARPSSSAQSRSAPRVGPARPSAPRRSTSTSSTTRGATSTPATSPATSTAPGLIPGVVCTLQRLLNGGTPCP